MKLILRFFGYVKVPGEVSRLAAAVRLRWVLNPRDPEIGAGLNTLATFLRSAR